MTDDEQAARERMAELDASSQAEAEVWIERMGLSGDEAESFRNHSRKWILIDGEPVVVGLYEWAKWFEDFRLRVVAQEDVIGPDAIYWVSTVFLGMDHSHFGGPPLIFETMVFRRHEPKTISLPEYGLERTYEKDEVYVRRYSTLAQAEAGHQLALEAARAADFEDA